MEKINDSNKKLFYSIKEVAKIVQINESTIRFWEKNFNQLNPSKNRNGVRIFKEKDIDILKMIYHLTKEKKLTIVGANNELNNNRNNVEKETIIIDKLTKLKATLIDIRDNLK